MKKLLAALVALVAINASAYDVTNTVTIVSNIYNRISEEHWITNNIKNTHTNYHYTNNVYTVSNVTLLVSQTNVHTTATYDMGRSMLSIMSNDVNSAKASIRSTADEAAGSASRASSSASSASSSAASAQNTLNNVNTRGAEIINGMNAKQNWFDQNYGKMITNHNIYVAEDQVARAGVSENSVRISTLNTRMGTAETNIGNLNTSVSGLSSRMGAAETNIENLDTSVSGLTTRVGTAENDVERLNRYARGDDLIPVYGDNRVWKFNVYVSNKDAGVYTLGWEIIVNTKSYRVVSANTYAYDFEYRNVSYLSMYYWEVEKINVGGLYYLQVSFRKTQSGSLGYVKVPLLNFNDPYDLGFEKYEGYSIVQRTLNQDYKIEYTMIPSKSRSIEFYITTNLEIYDKSSNLVDRLVRWSEITNWVEQTFQKK